MTPRHQPYNYIRAFAVLPLGYHQPVCFGRCADEAKPSVRFSGGSEFGTGKRKSIGRQKLKQIDGITKCNGRR